MKRLVAPLILFGLAAALIAWAVADALPRPRVIQVPDTAGHEAPQEGAYYDNGWIVANYGEAAMLEVYLRYQQFLGEPVSSFDGRCQSFRLGRLCYRSGNPINWKVEFANLGLEDLQVQGYTPRPGSTPHLALRDWLVAQLETGVDITRVVGRILSDPICDKKTGACRQWTDKQLFLFEDGALFWYQVQRAPLGLWLTHTRTRPVAVDPPEPEFKPNLVALVAGIALALPGLALLGSGRDGGGNIPV